MNIKTKLMLSLLPALAIGFALAIFLIFSEMTLSLSWFIGSIGVLTASSALSIHTISEKLTRRVKQLNDSALAIAAGQYGQSIEIGGPRELKELANTLNTMSECLLENINHIKEISLQKEQSYGEAACARLLQSHLLQTSIEECNSEALSLKAVTFSSSSPKGLLLDFPKSARKPDVLLHLIEAKEDGIHGMYELLSHFKRSDNPPSKSSTFSSLFLRLDCENSTILAKSSGFPLPFAWSQQEERLSLVKPSSQHIESGDFVFLMNCAFLEFFKNPARISQLFTKVLRVFGQEGLDICAAMLQKEISFLAKRRDLEEDLHLICLQVLIRDS